MARESEKAVDQDGQGRRSYSIDHGHHDTVIDGDFVYYVYEGWLDYRDVDLRVRADRAVLVLDRDEHAKALLALNKSGLPHRKSIPPVSQQDILHANMRSRLERRASTSGLRRQSVSMPPSRVQLALRVRAIWAQGNVLFERHGVRLVRCEELYLSLISDRGTMKQVEVRLPVGAGVTGNASFVLRSPRVVQQGDRLVARDARMTSCLAGEPHFEMLSQRVTVRQHADATELVGEGNALRVEGLPALPLPDFRYFTDQENWIPLKSISIGSSQDRGAFLLATFGGRWNDMGQSLIDAVATTDERFRGEWWLRTGYTQRRGSPAEGGLKFELPGAFRGEFEAFFLADEGFDRRSVTKHLDGSTIQKDLRTFVRGKLRVPIELNTRLDSEVFWATDAAAYPEFRPRALKDNEVPETSLHLRHAVDNRRLSVIGRINAVDYSYTDRATLGDSFRSEQPYARADLFSQPLFDLAGAWPLVVDVSAGGGRLKNKFDSHSSKRRREEAWRADLSVTASAPYTLFGFAATPYASLRQTWYSDTPNTSVGAYRKSVEGGMRLSTSLSRVFDAESELLDVHDLHHEVRPEINVWSRFTVDRSPMDYFQFDSIDALDEVSVIDVTVLQRVQTRRKDARGDSQAADIVFLDLTQRFFPEASRDNGGDRLGPLFFELIVTPGGGWLPVPNLRILFEGERDWAQSDFKTRNLGLAAGPILGLTVAAEWRSGRDGDGTGSFVVGTKLLGRWSLNSAVIWNFDRSEVNSTGFSIVRRDHDWSLVLGALRDANTGDTGIIFQFVPTLGGLVSGPRQRYVGGDPAFGVLRTTNY
jgi:hypothetical protein